VNRKTLLSLLRFFKPSMRLYFGILVFFGVLAFLFDYRLALIELLIVLLIFVYTRIMSKKQKNEVISAIHSPAYSTQDASTNSFLNMPLPMVIFGLNDGRVLWSNDEFLAVTGDREHLFEVDITDVVPGFSRKWLAEGRSVAPELVRLGDRSYRVYGSVFRMEGRQSSKNYWGIVYFVDVTEYERTEKEYYASRPIVTVIMLDNYEELIKNLNETSKSSLLAEIDRKINEWCLPARGYLSHYDRDRYIFIFEERYMQGFLDDKFTILDKVREIQNASGVAATLSIGIGRDANSFEEGYQFALIAIDMALSRGGDQAVIKNKLNFEFYGGFSSVTEKRTKVKARVMATALGELIDEASNIIIMSHKFADLDSIGGSVPLICIARKKDKPAKIVIDQETNVAKQIITRLMKLPEYANTFITAEEAIMMVDGKTLLVVVDTNRPDQVESLELLQTCNKIAVIDHHRRAADYIANATLNFHEPYASSASELGTELLQYLVRPSDILKTEAEAVLAGMVLDTKSFTIRTGSRTFEAAAFLRRAGSDTSEVKKLLQTDLGGAVQKYGIIQSAKLYKDGIALAVGRNHVDRIIAAQAADELLNITGISASFVISDSQDTVNISARSIGLINVQYILEKLGGGGNKATAGAQVKNKTIDQVLADLKAAIDEYLSDAHHKEKDKGYEGFI
jgi:c-di-AMP phosphodiesterase-like protein